jgi:hypothetical protein
MEPFEVRVRRWAEDTWSFLQRLSMDPRCPPDIRAEAHRWQLECEHLGDGAPHAWWQELLDDLP